MKKTIVIATLLALGSSMAIAQQGGYVGPSATATSKGGFTGAKVSGITTVAQLKHVQDDAKVVLRGNIVKQLANEKYLFKDSSGEIVIEIDDDDWKGVTAGPNDLIEIYGEVDKDDNTIEIDVDSLRKVS